MIWRLALRYLLVFAAVLFAISIVAYFFVVRDYASIAAPALGTVEGALGMRLAEMRVARTIVFFDIPLLMVVGAASFFLASTSIAPLVSARERERRFAADAAHQLRSPLATIASVAQAARSGAPPETRASLDTITGAALDGSAIVTDLLTLARDPSESALQLEPVDLAMIANRCAQEFVARSGERGIVIEIAAQGAIVEADERRLMELTRNLLENALRQARERIAVRSVRGERISRIEVEDDGPGVPADLRDRTSSVFFAVTKRQPKGLGWAFRLLDGSPRRTAERWRFATVQRAEPFLCYQSPR